MTYVTFAQENSRQKGTYRFVGAAAYNYDTTHEVFEVEQVVIAFGHVGKDNRWMLVKWSVHPDPEWERQHLFERNGCHEKVREFWTQSDLNPYKRYIHPRRQTLLCSLRQSLKARARRRGKTLKRTRQGWVTIIAKSTRRQKRQWRMQF